MCAQQQGNEASDLIGRALLKEAEADLLAAIRPGNHPHNIGLLEVHGFLWEAISRLSEIAAKGKGSG